jgi:hypothetical protein
MGVAALLGLDVGWRDLADGDDTVLPVVIARTGVKLPLAKARGFGACRTALRDSRRCQVGNGYSIPGLASAFSTVMRATRSDAPSALAL